MTASIAPSRAAAVHREWFPTLRAAGFTDLPLPLPEVAAICQSEPCDCIRRSHVAGLPVIHDINVPRRNLHAEGILEIQVVDAHGRPREAWEHFSPSLMGAVDWQMTNLDVFDGIWKIRLKFDQASAEASDAGPR